MDKNEKTTIEVDLTGLNPAIQEKEALRLVERYRGKKEIYELTFRVHQQAKDALKEYLIRRQMDKYEHSVGVTLENAPVGTETTYGIIAR